MLLGVAYAWAASLHDIGWGADFGPGFFPLVLAALMTLIGATLVFKSLTLEAVQRFFPKYLETTAKIADDMLGAPEPDEGQDLEG